MIIRSFAEGDHAAVDALLDVDASSVTRQLHRVHGPDRAAPKRRRTLVAEVDDRIVGAASLSNNRIHPGRLTGLVEVATTHRRHGIGTALFAAVRTAYGDSRPVSSKVAEADPAAVAFVTALGGRVYQRCPGVRIDPSDPRIAAWCALPRTRPVAPLSSLTQTEAAELFTTMYQWLHERWSPVGSVDALAESAVAIVADADLDRSSVAFASDGAAAAYSDDPTRPGAGHAQAVAFVFAEPDGSFGLVAEAITRDEPGGELALKAALVRSLTSLVGETGLVEVDGHDDDPHLSAVLATLPWAETDPVLLVEIDPAG